jgi:RNA polymerase nonessential primary-like sigma factor
MPNVFQLSEHLGLTVDEIKDLMCKARQPTSLEIKIGENRDTALIDLLEDETQLPENILEIQYIKEDIRELISDLPEMQAAVISMRYGIGNEMLEPMSMTAIGQVLNMSRDRVRTLEHKALRALRSDSDQIKEYL